MKLTTNNVARNAVVGSHQRMVGVGEPMPPRMSLDQYIKWKHRQWAAHDRMLNWIKDQKAHAAHSNEKLTDAGPVTPDVS